MERSILITGVSRGLGKELARKFLIQGFRVFGVYRRNVPDFTDAGFIPVKADINDDSCEKTIASALGEEPLEMLINNAGVGGMNVNLERVHATDLHLLFDTHCVGAMRVTKACIKNLLMHQSPEVININSRMGSVSGQYSGKYGHLEMSYEYRIAKAAQNMYSACLKNEFGDKLKVYQVHPGRVKTATAQVDADLEPSEAAANIYNRWSHGELREANGINDSESGTIYPW
jgi:NAD(P)-dependent dehydrogenase (short-subunit alcohol dehydrogenase family)